jgi:predicted dehydrogenase
MKNVRWGIIGCGNVTEVKSGPGLQRARNSELVAVMRRNGELARDYAQRHGVPKWYDNARALIEDPEVNTVYVATPPSSHMEYTIQAARAGKPVYVEKPMALNYAQCREMISVSEAVGVPLYVAYYRRALQRFLKVKELVDSDTLGQIRFVFLLGPIEHAQGFATNQAGNYLAEDMVSASFVFQSGVQGTGNWCFNAYEEMDRTEIVGEKGRLIYSTFDDQPVVLETVEGKKEFKIGYPVHIQQPLIQTVVDGLLGEGRCPSTGVSGARTTWVMDQILAGYKAQNEG